MRDILNLYTHDGIFHADDVFAAALLSLMCEDINVVRGSDTDIPEGGDWIVFDIGGGELDHHTPENKENNGTHPGTEIPYAACGLVWRKYYPEVLAAAGCPEQYQDLVYQKQIFELIRAWLGEPPEAGGESADGSRAVISVVHDLSLARTYGTKALLLCRGETADIGTISDVFDDTVLNPVYDMDVRQWMSSLYKPWA